MNIFVITKAGNCHHFKMIGKLVSLVAKQIRGTNTYCLLLSLKSLARESAKRQTFGKGRVMRIFMSKQIRCTVWCSNELHAASTG
jgi:hypothetical protein